jgi:hypothetical protein
MDHGGLVAHGQSPADPRVQSPARGNIKKAVIGERTGLGTGLEASMTDQEVLDAERDGKTAAAFRRGWHDANGRASTALLEESGGATARRRL